MQQANPDAGNARTSDSNGMGAGVIPLEQIICAESKSETREAANSRGLSLAEPSHARCSVSNRSSSRS